MAADAPSPFLALPRELRDEILGYLTLPHYIYTSTSTPDTRNLYQSRRASGSTYIDTRIRLSSRPPANILETCRQLRQEALEHHARLLTPQSAPTLPDCDENDKQPMSNVLAERLGAEFAETAEHACDDGTLRITLEVQRSLRGVHGYYVPVREELSPRFLALLPLMEKARKLKLTIWPGFDWWNGGPQSFDKRGNPLFNRGETSKPNAASVAIGKILHCFPQLEELDVDVLVDAFEAGRWDLPDRKWENIQPWLDAAITSNVGESLREITRKLIAFWKITEPEPFYTQYETRQSTNTWDVNRKGDMCTVSMKSLIDISDDEEFLKSLVVKGSFVRTD
ncbi:hypothetical protein TUN199_08923 [Pyrenophora tritici-repentis]|nr:hypothetical protein TUN199_08923 [Pyrenophora tritici-repentis]